MGLIPPETQIVNAALSRTIHRRADEFHIYRRHDYFKTMFRAQTNHPPLIGGKDQHCTAHALTFTDSVSATAGTKDHGGASASRSGCFVLWVLT